MTNTPRIHQGTLVLDQDRRYCIYEPDRPPFQLITLTSGLVIELWLEESSKWVVGRIEGDGEQYWCFLRSGGRLRLTEGLLARFLEPCWHTLCTGDKPVAMLAAD